MQKYNISRKKRRVEDLLVEKGMMTKNKNLTNTQCTLKLANYNKVSM